MDELPFRVEYAKSARSSCKSCKGPIAKDELRIARMVQSLKFDGRMPMWFHFQCFFTRPQIKSTADIAHFESIKWDDQERIRSVIERLGTDVEESGSKKKKSGKKRKPVTSSSVSRNIDFYVEYAKSSRAVCRGCDEKIAKGEVRISKKDHETDEGKKFGGLDMWHHTDCFMKLRVDLKFWDAGFTIPGFEELKPEDQKELETKLPKIERPPDDEVEAVIPAKKIKKEDTEERRKQNKQMFEYRDQLKQLTKSELTSLLEYNGQMVPSGIEKILDRLTDVMTFGTLLPCPECKYGQYMFRSGVGYYCLGHKNEWLRCEHVTDDPKRAPFKIPKELKEKYPVLASYKYTPQKRLFTKAPSSAVSHSGTSGSSSTSTSNVDGKPKVERFAPLRLMTFVFVGCDKEQTKVLKSKIVKLGGKVLQEVLNDTTAIISDKTHVEKMGQKMTDAQLFEIQVVPPEFVDECGKEGTEKSDVYEKIKSMNIAPWATESDPSTRHRVEEFKRIRQIYATSAKMEAKEKTIKVKDGVAIDPNSELEDVAHVYRSEDTVYNTALANTDIQTGRNSYYKMQILESDDKSNPRYWLFRSWGRIGTVIGGKKCEEMDLDEAIAKFEEHFEQKSGNMWKNRRHFVKVPGKSVLMDVTYEEERLRDLPETVPSKLAPQIQDLISLIFNISAMKNMMLEYELDLEKMPLGKLSKKQIENAYKVLTKLQGFLENGGTPDSQQLIEYTNQFYTLIPHNFGIHNPPIINNVHMVETKREMLDNLLEIEIAYNIVKCTETGETDMHHLDMYYHRLKADIEVLDKSTEEFKLLQEYVQNTHGATHDEYTLEIDEVFKVRRQGEDKRFKPFEKLHNKKLLWHGSRLTNYVGILSQGLRIAPPEAPPAGYMFGKGIYFADMVSKSANYCNAHTTDNTGLLLLCEVALGNMWEKHDAYFVKKLPNDKHSVKGLGRTIPDPAGSVVREDGVEVPMGKGVPSNVKNGTLLYNEYIVYDVAQVKIRYLLKMKFVPKPKKGRARK